VTMLHLKLHEFVALMSVLLYIFSRNQVTSPVSFHLWFICFLVTVMSWVVITA